MADVVHHAFPDTNIFLHYPPLDHIDWCAELGAKEVVLVVCLQVIDELDEKKDHSQFGERAARSLKQIRDYHRTGKEVRNGVTLTIYSKDLQAGGVLPATGTLLIT